MCNRILTFLKLEVITLILIASTALADDRPFDYKITQNVEKELRNDYRLRDADIDVRTISGNVMLSGKVDSFYYKHYVGRLCKKIEGIRGLSNRLEIEPLPHNDDEIAQVVTRRWEDDTLLRAQKLKAAVGGRVVTIEGIVANFFQRTHAERLAREVRGVFLVRNELQVDSVAAARRDSPSTSDWDIRVGAWEAIDRDAVLFRMPIDVIVEEGVVTLIGAVNNLHERNSVINRIRSLPGVKRVNNQLMVGTRFPSVLR